MKRIVVANDLVGVGKVALSASIPLMASCLLEQVLLPTCLLSSHTGGGQNPVKHTTSSILDVFLTDWDNKRWAKAARMAFKKATSLNFRSNYGR